jgi:hypothetical protein
MYAMDICTEAHRKGSHVASSYGNATLKLELALPMMSDLKKEPLHQKTAAAKKIAAAKK